MEMQPTYAHKIPKGGNKMNFEWLKIHSYVFGFLAKEIHIAFLFYILYVFTLGGCMYFKFGI